MSGGEGNGQITILVVTADPGFVADCEHHLGTSSDIDLLTATTVGEAIDRLTANVSIECIVSDHDLPDTDGIAFLETVRAQAPTLPFILFTSEGSESVASKAISADVTEYLIKEQHSDQWERLRTLIEDAVRFYRDRSHLVNTETRAKSLLDAARDTITVVRDGHIEYLNETGVDLFGIESTEVVIGQAVADWIESDTDSLIPEQLAAVQAGEEMIKRATTDLSRADGTTRPIEVTASHIEWAETPAIILIIRDISDRKERERDRQLKTRAMDEAPIGITIADATQSDNPLIYANEAFERITGYSAAEMRGRNCRILQGEGTALDPVADMREAIDAEEPVTVELRNYRKDGTEFWNRVTIAPVTNDAGEVTHYVGFQEDVTERKESEESLRRFRQAVQAAGHAIYMTDVDGTIRYVNPAFKRITGYDASEAIGETPRILQSGEMDAAYYERLWETILDGEIWEEEIRDQRKNGEVYYAHQTIAPVADEDGDLDAFVAIHTDITAQKEREHQLRQYERAIEGANELIAAIDEEWHYLFANEAYRTFHDIDPDEVTDLTLEDGIGRDTFEIVESYVEQAFDGKQVQYQMTRTQPDKPARLFNIRYYPLLDDDEDVTGVVATMRDLTGEKEREQQLAALDRMLRHNIHNELNVILGHAEGIATDSVDDPTEVASTIMEAANRILRHADKEREIVKLLTDPSPPTVVAIDELVQRVVDEIETTYPEAEIAVEVPDEITITTLPEIERAVLELVENAVIHTDQETPTVTISAATHPDMIELTVADNGPGIPVAEQQVIADEAEIDPLLHSSGMGLWLVKRIINRVEGTIKFEETTDGSRVRLMIPRGRDRR